MSTPVRETHRYKINPSVRPPPARATDLAGLGLVECDEGSVHSVPGAPTGPPRPTARLINARMSISPWPTLRFWARPNPCRSEIEPPVFRHLTDRSRW